MSDSFNVFSTIELTKNGIFTRNQNKYLDITTLYFHLGQILAMQNKIGEAIPWFYKSIGDGGDWDNYVKATIAFLRKDKINFEKKTFFCERLNLF